MTAEPISLDPLPAMVRRYLCPLCRRPHAEQKRARKHIARCWLNPAARACKTCAFFTDEPDGEHCVPGEPCGCNRGFQRCEAGVKDVADGRIVSGCPLWQLKEGKVPDD